MKYNKKRLWLLIPLVIFIGLLALFINDIVNIFPLINSQSEESIRAALDTLGIRGAITLGLILSMQLILVFLPCEFIEIISGLTYGPFWGSLICLIGMLIGASIIYALVNVFNFTIEKLFSGSKSYDTIQKLNNNTKSVSKLLLILCFLPALPVGMICYFGSSTNLNYFRYLIICAIGVLPSIIIDSALGYVFIATIGKYYLWILLGIIVFTIVVTLIIKSITDKKINKHIYGTSKPTMEMVLQKDKRKEPNGLYYKMLLLIGKFYKKKYNINIKNDEIKNLKPPYIVLSPHSCYADFILSTQAIKPQKANIMANIYYLYKKSTRSILKKVQVIPKKLFCNDIKAIKDCIQVVKNDGVIIMMPEARLSADGSNQKLPNGIEKLVKKLNIPIVYLKTNGAYLSMAKWMKKSRKGRIDVEAKLLIDKDELKDMSNSDVLNKINRALTYNDFDWQKENHVEFKGKNLLKGLDDLLYICPNCKKEFTLNANKNTIKCEHCGMEIEMDNYYNFINSPIKDINNIQDWFLYQIECVKDECKDSNWELKEDVILKSFNEYGKGLEVKGKGCCILNKDSIKYIGTFDGKEHIMEEPISSLQALPFGCGEDWELYSNNIFYYFVPINNPKQCVKWSIFADVAHNNAINKDDEQKKK